MNLNVLLSDEDAPIWRELTSIFAPIVVLSILFFTVLGRGRYIGEGEMQYVPFLMFALVGLGICAIIYHAVGLLERAVIFLKSKGKIAVILANIVLFAPMIPLWYWFLFMLKNMPWSAMLGLAVLLIIFLFLIIYARMSYMVSLYEVYLRVLVPLVLFLLFLGIAVFDVDAFGIYGVSSYAYFLFRPFISHLIRVRAPSASKT